MKVEEKIINILNDLAEKDPEAIKSLLCVLPATNNKVLTDYDVKMQHHDYPTIGIITILNKVIEETGKKIKINYKIESFSGAFELIGFELEERK